MSQECKYRKFSKEFRELAPRSLLLAAVPATQNRIFVAWASVDRPWECP